MIWSASMRAMANFRSSSLSIFDTVGSSGVNQRSAIPTTTVRIPSMRKICAIASVCLVEEMRMFAYLSPASDVAKVSDTKESGGDETTNCGVNCQTLDGRRNDCSAYKLPREQEQSR